MKKRLFALCAMGMVMLSGCGSSGTAPAEVADNAATGGAAAVETYTPAESVASESSMDYDFSEPAAAAAAEAPAGACCPLFAVLPHPAAVRDTAAVNIIKNESTFVFLMMSPFLIHLFCPSEKHTPAHIPRQ